MMPSSTSRRRIVAAVVAFILAACAAYYAVKSHREGERLAAWSAAEPARAEVDLSHPGVIETPFVQTCRVAHAQEILLRLDGPVGPLEDVLLGLTGRMEIVADRDRVVFAQDIIALPRAEAGPEAVFVLARPRPFEIGRYTLRLRIDQPAPALAGRSQTLTARYLLCGLEAWPAFVTGAAAVATGSAATIVGLLTVLGWYRHRRGREAPAGRV